MKCFVVNIQGEIQGVGFRPWIAKVAKKYNINGIVYNKINGVSIELDCTEAVFEKFKIDLLSSANPGVISNLSISELPAKNFKYFQIANSENKNNTDGHYPIIPDRKICKSCCYELFKQDNRRYLYPFITCASCGPRFSIAKALPFDRGNTTMNQFDLCSDCMREYQDLDDTRFHAQTISCANCGPKLEFLHFDRKNTKQSSDFYINHVVSAINLGNIIAIKGIGGYHLVGDATNDLTILKLREIKNRKSKPLAIMCKNILMVKKYCQITVVEREILEDNAAPIVLLTKRDDCEDTLSKYISPGLADLGVFLPYTGLHYLLFHSLNKPLVMTSANLSGHPIAFTLDDIIQQFANKIYGVLTDNRAICFPCDDSVIRVINNRATFIRRARGYSLQLKQKTLNSYDNNNDLAVGAQMKNTIAIRKGDIFYISPYLGDIASFEYIKRFEYYRDNLIRILQLNSNVNYIADKHPDYEINKYLTSKKIAYKTVQHHHAHAYASLFEYPELTNAYIMVWDGTGLGDDKQIWGGEGFLYHDKKLLRDSSLKPFKLLGGEQAIKEPKRIALSLLWHVYGLERDLLPPLWLNWINTNFSSSEINIYRKMWLNNINSVLTSSMGRLLDGLASLLNICHVNDFDGHAPMLLEAIANDNKASLVESDSLTIDSPSHAELNIINWHDLIKYVDISSLSKVSINYLAWYIHNILANTVITIVKTSKIKNLLLTGGVFQNKLLTELIIDKANNSQVSVYQPKEVSVNDSGLAVGQIFHGIST